MNDRMPLTDRLDAGPVICAEGFLFELERRGYLTAGEFVPEVALEYPDALRALHLDYQRAGSDVVEAFWVNVRLFLLAEVLIIAFGLLLAVVRALPGPALFPLRAMATLYVDVFRAIPGLLIIYVLGFGIPGLGIDGIPNDPFFWAVVTLTLVYSAYVSEVFRAGIESVHPSQNAAARSLGLSQLQSLRYVVIPQAFRRVIPPLLNDFIGLQKDTVLVSLIGVVEIFRTAQIKAAANFNFTPFLAVALVFLVVTLPLSRLTEWLVIRQRRRQLGGGGVR